jgi:hypothetical protein
MTTMTDPYEKESELERILFHTIQEKLQQKKTDGFKLYDVILPVFQEMLEFSDQIVLDLEENGHCPEVACQSGCSYCCHSQVSVIPIEALLIGAFIKTDFSRMEISELHTGMSQINARTCGKTLEQIYVIKDGLPCLFLKQGKCRIYHMRPSICRSWNSFDSAACRSAYDSADYRSQVPGSPARNLIFGTTRSLFKDLSDVFSLQSDILSLPHAVSDCLNSTDPLAQWLNGDVLFTGRSHADCIDS